MVEKKKIWICACSIAVLLIVLAVGAGVFVYRSQSDSDVKNVFDEMIEKKYVEMEAAEQITAGGYDAFRLLWTVKEGTPLKIGIVYSTEYKKLYIYGDAAMPEEIQDMSYQEYFEECLETYDITWEEVEDSKEEFICKNILGKWFAEYESSFSKDRLGELEVLDFLMPYEYCGKDNSKWKTVTETVEEGYRGTFQGKIEYTIWDAGTLLCRQTQKSRDYGYHDVMERIEADMNGFNTVSEEIVVEWYHKWKEEDGDEWEYIPLTDVFGGKNVSEFPDWIKSSGKVKGNLTKLSYTREEGEAKTREILEQYAEERIFEFFQTAEYYIAGDELNIRLAYYDYEAENPGWVENGKGEVWQGWITVKIDDIREFLSGDGFYIEAEEIYLDEWEIEHIEALSMSYSDGVTQDDINRIGQCRNLKKLEIYIWNDELDLSPLSNLTNLEAIELGAYAMNKIDVSFLSDLTELKEFTLYGSEIEDYSFFYSLWQLRDVWMLGNTTIEDLSFFSDMHNLKSLYIDGVQDADLLCLANCENIEKICIAGHQIRNVEGLANLSQVKELGFYEYGVYGEERLTFNLHCLDNMAKLESLSLMYVNVEDISPLADKQILETIRLVDTGIEDIEPLKNLDNLNWLVIGANKSEKVKEQSELYFNDVEHVNVSREILNDKL